MPRHAAEEAGCICLDLPFYSPGLSWPSQLHSAQQTKGLLSASVQINSRFEHGSELKLISLLFSLLQVRKAAQQGVCAILRGSDFLFKDNAPTHHPAATTTAKFCAKEIEQAGGTDNADVALMQS